MSTWVFGIGYWEITVILIVIFILFGHRLPGVMRLLGRSVVDSRQRLLEVDRQRAVLACLALLAFLIGALAVTLFRVISGLSG